MLPETDPKVPYKRHFDALRDLDHTIDHIESLADGACSLGLGGLSKQLYSISNTLSDIRTRVADAFMDEFNDHIESVRQG